MYKLYNVKIPKLKMQKVLCFCLFFFACNRDLSNLAGPPFPRKGTRQMDCQVSTSFEVSERVKCEPRFLESPRDFFQTEQALLIFLLLFTRRGNSFGVRAFEI